VVTGVGFLRRLSWCMLCVRGCFFVFDVVVVSAEGAGVVGTGRLLEGYYALLRIVMEGWREVGESRL